MIQDSSVPQFWSALGGQIYTQLPIALLVYRYTAGVHGKSEFRLVEANLALKKVVGLSPVDVENKSLDENFPGFRALGIPQSMESVIQNGKTVLIEDLPYQDERIPWCFISLTVFPLSEDHVGVALSNVTDRKMSDLALQDSEERFRDVASIAGDFILETDAAEQLSFLSERFGAITGRSTETFIGQPLGVLFGHSARGIFEARLGQLSKSTGAVMVFQGAAQAETDEKWISLSVKPILDPQTKNFLGWRGLGQDITEKRRAEQIIAEQQAQIQASSKLSALGEMAGGVAHEINNPLMVIQGYATQVADMVASPDKYQDALKSAATKIQETCQRIARIIRGLRTFSRDGSQDPFEETSVKAVIEDSLSLCASRFRHEEVALDFVCKADIRAEIRATQISQVLLNLLNNALDAVKGLKNSWVKIELTSPSSTSTGQLLEISVTDSGPGIPPAIRDKIMQPFFTTKEVGQGTGLGLSISRGIAQSHRGVLLIDESSPNTRFVLRLPLVSSE